MHAHVCECGTMMEHVLSPVQCWFPLIFSLTLTWEQAGQGVTGNTWVLKLPMRYAGILEAE